MKRKCGYDEALPKIFHPGTIHQSLKKGVLSLQTAYDMQWRYRSGFLVPKLWIPQDNEHSMAVEISERGMTPVWRYEAGFDCVVFFVRAGDEALVAKCFASVDEQFCAGQLSQSEARTEVVKFLDDLEERYERYGYCA